MLHPHGVAVVLGLALTPREGLANLHHCAAEVRGTHPVRDAVAERGRVGLAYRF